MSDVELRSILEKVLAACVTPCNKGNAHVPENKPQGECPGCDAIIAARILLHSEEQV